MVNETEAERVPAQLDGLLSLAGSAEGPEDLSSEHDEHLYPTSWTVLGSTPGRRATLIQEDVQ